MDFGYIIKRSLGIAWRHKSLWVFGVFTYGGGDFNLDISDYIDADDYSQIFKVEEIEDLSSLLSAELVAGVILLLLGLMAVYILCHLISMPAMIDAVNKITRGGMYRFGESFSRGIDFFPRFFGLMGLSIFAFIAWVGALIVLAVVLTPFSLILTIPASIVFGFVMWHIFALAEVAIVARDCSIGDGIMEGWEVFKNNLANCGLITLIYIGIAIAIGIAIFMIAMVTFLPINLLVLAITESLMSIILLGLFLGLPVSLVLGGFTGTFFSALYIQFYFHLVEGRPASDQPLSDSQSGHLPTGPAPTQGDRGPGF